MSWPKVIREIRSYGMTSKGIAYLCGTSPKVIEHLLSGHNKFPPVGVGERLIRLRNALAACSLSQAPSDCQAVALSA